MKFIIKFEEFANKYLIKLQGLIYQLMLKITPQKVIDFKRQFVKRYLQKKSDLITKFKVIISTIITKIKTFKLEEFKNNISGKVSKFLEDAKTLSPAKIKSFLKKFFTSAYQWIKHGLIQLKEKPVFGVGLLLLIVFGGSFSIYKISSGIALKSGLRRPASIPKGPEAVRPKYYKLYNKQFDFVRVAMPIYIEGSKSMKSVKIDFTIEANNRTTILYILDNQHKFYDYLNTQIEPIVPTFPLNLEGREIMREKIILELNSLLKKGHIEGKINNVYLKDIIGG